MARATLVCCVLSVFVICLLLFYLLFFCLFVCCCFFCLFCFFFVFFWGGGGGCFVLLLFCYGFLWLVLDALDLVRNTKRNSEQTEYVHIRTARQRIVKAFNGMWHLCHFTPFLKIGKKCIFLTFWKKYTCCSASLNANSTSLYHIDDRKKNLL